MRIGYACKTIGVPNCNFKNCILRNATPEKLRSLIEHNLNSLDSILNYNINTGIYLFRISSDLITFASNPANQLDWSNMFKNEFIKIGNKIKSNGMRVSMHPGQYTVINSPNEKVIRQSIKELEYHCKVLDSMKLNSEHKLILHIGGIYGDKKEATKRFIKNYNALSINIKKRLVIENDEKLYNIEDALKIGKEINCPVIFDNLHHEINKPQTYNSIQYWIDECNNTWGKKDGNQKIHYSQQNKTKKTGSHSSTIALESFLDFTQNISLNNLDIMLEVKDKNLSAIKCINALRDDKTINHLKSEWNLYKYSILEKDSTIYLKINDILNYKSKNNYPVKEFYNLIDTALNKDQTVKDSLNGILHAWEGFNNIVEVKEKSSFFKEIEKFKKGNLSLTAIKNKLKKLAVKYNYDELLYSYYFYMHNML
ncbi:UV DNA damage repair endonuclease UvsE [Anaerovorax odorimutans]|uniref:UV DNA damage repair endonuclease UvsE n=1 Tax=Anaerovorax odorimutans TaxID=109327 RepID=UPI00048174AC|nr:UV DNA damage repair endonuclease UvsE [Anaerovorax odorimutans]